MNNIILNTIKESTKYLSLKDTLKLRLICKKLKSKINQEIIIDIIKERYTKYLKYGDKIFINIKDFDDETNSEVKYVHFIEFSKMVTHKYWKYTMKDGFVGGYKRPIYLPDKIYPRSKFYFERTRTPYYLDIPSNKIVSLNSQIRKHVGVSKLQEVVNLCVDIINPTRDIDIFRDIYDLEKIHGIRHLSWFVLIMIAMFPFFYIIFGSVQL